MPLRTVRWSLAGRPVRGFCAGSRGCNRSHCTSVKSLVCMLGSLGPQRVCRHALDRALTVLPLLTPAFRADLTPPGHAQDLDAGQLPALAGLRLGPELGVIVRLIPPVTPAARDAALEDRIASLERQLAERTEEIRRRDVIIHNLAECVRALPAGDMPQDRAASARSDENPRVVSEPVAAPVATPRPLTHRPKSG
jgi:hypothetical protein